MKDKVLALLDGKLDHLGVWVDDVYEEQEGSLHFLRIVIDRSEIMDVEEVTEVAKIINPIIDEANLVSNEYILDIYAKSKGESHE